MTKEEIQQKVYKDLRDEPNIVLKWATGIGKSKETIDIINYKINKAKKKLSVLLVVAERTITLNAFIFSIIESLISENKWCASSNMIISQFVCL